MLVRHSEINKPSIVCEDLGKHTRKLKSHGLSLFLIEILVEDLLLPIAMSDTDLKNSQLLIILQLIDHEYELFETDLETISRKVDWTEFQHPKLVIQFEHSLIQDCLGYS